MLDLGLPYIDGLDACRRIREQRWGRQMLLIAVTGWGQDIDRRRSSEAGFDHHLVKPVDARMLQSLLAGQQPSASSTGV
jgi:DNA-binding response OmpR family regulator